MSNEPLSDLRDAELQEKRLPEPFAHLFSQLRPSDVEQFSNAYQAWTLYKQIDLLSLQIARTRQELQANEELLHLVQPTALELSTLAQLQALGVNDIDLLDRLHARGEAWLDNAMQLLEHCERMDLIQGDYTQWCEHALEGAYDWLSSINEDDLTNAENAIEQPDETRQEQTEIPEISYDEQTEALLLRKLLSETDESFAEEEEPDGEIPSQITSPEEIEEESVHTEEILNRSEPDGNREEKNSDETASDTLLQPALLADQQNKEQESHLEIPEISASERKEIKAIQGDVQTIDSTQETPKLDEDINSDQERTEKYPILVLDETVLAQPDSSSIQSSQQAHEEKQKLMQSKKRDGFLHRLFRRFFRFFLKV